MSSSDDAQRPNDTGSASEQILEVADVTANVVVSEFVKAVSPEDQQHAVTLRAAEMLGGHELRDEVQTLLRKMVAEMAQSPSNDIVKPVVDAILRSSSNTAKALVLHVAASTLAHIEEENSPEGEDRESAVSLSGGAARAASSKTRLDRGRAILKTAHQGLKIVKKGAKHVKMLNRLGLGLVLPAPISACLMIGSVVDSVLEAKSTYDQAVKAKARTAQFIKNWYSHEKPARGSGSVEESAAALAAEVARRASDMAAALTPVSDPLMDAAREAMMDDDHAPVPDPARDALMDDDDDEDDEDDEDEDDAEGEGDAEEMWVPPEQPFKQYAARAEKVTDVVVTVPTTVIATTPDQLIGSLRGHERAYNDWSTIALAAKLGYNAGAVKSEGAQYLHKLDKKHTLSVVNLSGGAGKVVAVHGRARIVHFEYRDRSGETVLVYSISGTDSLGDLFADLAPRPWMRWIMRWVPRGLSGTPSSIYNLSKTDVRWHAGIMSYAGDAYDTISKHLEHRKVSGLSAPDRIAIYGHSLGAASAIIAGHMLRYRNESAHLRAAVDELEKRPEGSGQIGGEPLGLDQLQPQVLVQPIEAADDMSETDTLALARAQTKVQTYQDTFKVFVGAFAAPNYVNTYTTLSRPVEDASSDDFFITHIGNIGDNILRWSHEKAGQTGFMYPVSDWIVRSGPRQRARFCDGRAGYTRWGELDVYGCFQYTNFASKDFLFVHGNISLDGEMHVLTTAGTDAQATVDRVGGVLGSLAPNVRERIQQLNTLDAALSASNIHLMNRAMEARKNLLDVRAETVGAREEAAAALSEFSQVKKVVQAAVKAVGMDMTDRDSVGKRGRSEDDDPSEHYKRAHVSPASSDASTRSALIPAGYVDEEMEGGAAVDPSTALALVCTVLASFLGAITI